MEQPAADEKVSARSHLLDSARALVEDLTSNAGSVQQKLLCEILAQNSCTEYLLNVAETATRSKEEGAGPAPATMALHTFKRFTPLISSYEDLRPYIERIADGDKSPILTAHPVLALFASSGTSSGVRKFFPAIESDLERIKLLFASAVSVIHQCVGICDNGKEASFNFMLGPEEWTVGGVPKHAMTVSLFRSPWMQQHIRDKHVCPIELKERCADVSQCIYCHLLCALIRRQEVVQVDAFFASSMLGVLQILQERWQELVKDIRSGSVSESMIEDLTMRRAVEALMNGPDPSLAMLVEEECLREPRWQGIIRRLWPRAKYVGSIVSGSMMQYIPMLEFFSGGLPLISSYYASSECMLGINMNPLCNPYEVSYTLIPNMAYFEFLPLGAHNLGDDDTLIDPSLLVDLVNVQLGEEYEIVVTTFSGLYRYRLGDILRVTGFYKEAPQFHIVGRKNVVLSIHTDKTDELTLQRAVEVARSSHLEAMGDCRLVDYTSYTDVSSVPGHYVLFWEVAWNEEMRADASVFEACCFAMEKCFDDTYKHYRKSCIGPLEIKVVMPGSFHALRCAYVERGASISQYKTPRCLKLASMIELLNSRVSHSFFSPNCPVYD